MSLYIVRVFAQRLAIYTEKSGNADHSRERCLALQKENKRLKKELEEVKVAAENATGPSKQIDRQDAS